MLTEEALGAVPLFSGLQPEESILVAGRREAEEQTVSLRRLGGKEPQPLTGGAEEAAAAASEEKEVEPDE